MLGRPWPTGFAGPWSRRSHRSRSRRRCGRREALRQTEHGYDLIRAPLPAVVAGWDAINEPRYPSLKGIMGAKNEAAGDGVAGRRRRGRGLRGRGRREDDSARPRPTSVSWRSGEDRGRRLGGAEGPRPHRREEAPVKSLVFLEHHRSKLEKGALGVLAKAATLGEAACVVFRRGRSGACGRSRRVRSDKGVRLRGNGRSWGPACLPRPCRCLRDARRDDGSGGRSLRGVRARCRCRVAVSQRVSTRVSTGILDHVARRRRAVGKRPALGNTVPSTSAGRAARSWRSVRAGAFNPVESGGSAKVETFRRRSRGLLRARDAPRRAHAGRVERAIRTSRKPTSSSPVDAGSARRRASP